MESDLQAKEKFTGLAEDYDRARPDYSDEAIDFALKHCHLKPGDLLVDVGSGTGISSRAFARHGLKVTGIEPNIDMRKQAQLANDQLGEQSQKVLTYQDGSAEHTGLSDKSAAAVISAQAFHWFDAEKALIEFARILKPGGWLILLWNQEDESHPCTRGYTDLMRKYGDTKNILIWETAKRESGNKLLDSDLFTQNEKFVFANQQTLDQQGLVDRALSNSYAPKEIEPKETLIASLKQLFQQQQKNGQITLQYNLELYVGNRS